MRTGASRKLFNWKDAASWKPLFRALAGKRAGRVRLARALMASFDGVAAYHGCRPEEIESYYRNGLWPSSSAALDARAKEIFCSNAAGITPDEIDEITAKLGKRDQGRIYACIDDRHMIAYSAHYLIYGSERLQCVAAALSTEWRDCMVLLKRYGKPTIFRIALPWEMVTESDFEDLARQVSSHVSIVRKRRLVPETSFSFEFIQPLPAEFVLSHEHPKTVVDPHDRMKPYSYGAATGS